MKYRLYKPLIWIAVLMLTVGLACGLPSSATEEPQQVAPAEPVKSVDAAQPAEPVQPAQPVSDPVSEPVAEPVKPAAEPVAVSSGPVTSLQEVQGAVIQIQAQGTFVDPEYGEYFGGGSGSGFIIHQSGLAVTNNHVVTGAATLTIYIGGDTTKSYNAEILGVSECSDLAVIDIEGEGFPYLEWHEGDINVGLDIYTAGFPLGEPEFTLTKGIVSKSSTGGDTSWASIDSVLMHDATINPGNSGGALITAEGKVVGVNYRGRGDQDQYFAIGRDVAVPIIEKLKTGEDVDTIGVNGTAVVWGENSEYSGIWVSSVASGSPADKTGIESGDIITALEGTPLGTDGTLLDYCKVIRTHGASGTIAVEVLRFSTSEVLEGQLNGTPLATTYSAGDNTGTDTGGTAGTDATSEFVWVTDEFGALYVEVPSWWGEYDDSRWEADWNGLLFSAASVVVSPDLDGYYSYYDVPGVHFAASEDWGKIGGYVQLLDAAGGTWYAEDCEKEGRYDYEDPVYEGAIDVWKCAVGTESWVLAARPITNPFAFLVLIQLQYVPEYDPDAIEAQWILDTFDVDPTYLP